MIPSPFFSEGGASSDGSLRVRAAFFGSGVGRDCTCCGDRLRGGAGSAMECNVKGNGTFSGEGGQSAF